MIKEKNRIAPTGKKKNRPLKLDIIEKQFRGFELKRIK